MDNIKVSVCMTTYNHERYIAQAVESALRQQTTFPFEIVIGEDCSADRTQEILRDLAEKHPDTIRLRLAKRNMGGKPNFLETIARCRGQYVAMLEGDDYWTCADKLQRQIDALEAHPEWAMCFHPCGCLYEDGTQGIPVYPHGWTKPVATIEDLFASNFIPTGSVVFCNHLFPEFPQWFHELLIGDWPLHILNAAHGDIGFMPEVMSVYRIHKGGIWGGASPAERIIAVFELLNAVDHHFGGKYTCSINRYRADTIRYVMGQLDAATLGVTDVAEQLRLAESQAEAHAQAFAFTRAHAEAKLQAHARAQEQESFRSSSLEINMRKVLSHRNKLLSDMAMLEKEYARLSEDTLRLQAFYDTWTKSIAYRVEREIRRPIRRLRKYLQNRIKSRRGQARPKDPTISKAA